MTTDGTPLTNEERKERVAKIEAWMTSFFKSDFDKLCSFAAIMMERSMIVETEHKELVEKLNQIHAIAHDLSLESDIPAHVKRNIANMYLEVAMEPASLTFISGMNVSKQLHATANAHKSHAEHHAMKAEVFLWCDANMAGFRSMDAAAEAIAGKIVPIKFRTARDWIGEWRKLRSASTP